jgi:hypothetical protein
VLYPPPALVQELAAGEPGPSLDEPQGEAYGAWVQEIDQRADQVENGTAELVDWAVARDQIAERLKARR